MKKKCAVIVQGDKHQWVFYADGTDADLDAWADDGLIVGDILNTIPAWLPDFLITPWCKVQDAWRWMRLF